MVNMTIMIIVRIPIITMSKSTKVQVINCTEKWFCTGKTILYGENSPGLWPMACQILDILPFFPSSLLILISSSFLPSFPSSFVFGIYRARIVGCARGGSRATFLGPITAGRPSNFVLKSLLFSIPLFFDFGFILGPKMASKIDQNPLKIAFESALQFQNIFS